jgi:hypothetical protein
MDRFTGLWLTVVSGGFQPLAGSGQGRISENFRFTSMGRDETAAESSLVVSGQPHGKLTVSAHQLYSVM